MHRTLLYLAVVAAACGGSPAPARPPTPPIPPAATATPPSYHATIRWTSYGVPHIVARDVGSLGYGQGYAMAEAHVCTIADVILRVRGERARWFGPGDDDANLTTDFANRHLGFATRAEAAWPSLSADSKAMLDGFAAGYDRWLADHPPATRPAPCKDAAWVQPIRGVDVAAHGLATATLASSRFLEGSIAGAAPGAATTGAIDARPRGLASNAWAIGGDRTASGGGLLIANPHFPWEGDLQFFESQLTIPGDLDVYGVSLIGIPGVQIGLTAHHAWSHTYSASTHMAIYRLHLSDDSAVRYHHGDDMLAITPARYTIDVRKPDGSLGQVERTLYKSALGPMLSSPGLAWDGPGGFAFTVRDVAAGSALALDQYLAMARAGSRAEFEQALARHGTPFVNTIYADRDGDALYVDGSRVPALSDEGLAAWGLARKLVPAVDQAWQRGLLVLDGSNPIFDLAGDDPHAPGAVPFADVPRVLRRDFVINANDSYRFTNLDAPEAAAERSPLWGDDAGRPSPRTLENLAMLRAGDAAAGDDGKFTLDEAAAAILSGRSFTAERLHGDLAAVCKDKRARAIAAPCKQLLGWNGRFAVGERGAALWRETMVAAADDDRIPWTIAFDRQAPALSPGGIDHPRLAAAIATAAALLGEHAGDRLGDLQFATRGAARAPVPGGDELDGTSNVVGWRTFNFTRLPRGARAATRSASGLTADGYPVNYGSSFILAAELTPAGPRASALLTYGNSSDPASPYYRDQLDRFAAAQLRPVRFSDADITADPAYRVQELASP